MPGLFEQRCFGERTPELEDNSKQPLRLRSVHRHGMAPGQRGTHIVAVLMSKASQSAQIARGSKGSLWPGGAAALADCHRLAEPYSRPLKCAGTIPAYLPCAEAKAGHGPGAVGTAIGIRECRHEDSAPTRCGQRGNGPKRTTLGAEMVVHNQR